MSIKFWISATVSIGNKLPTCPTTPVIKHQGLCMNSPFWQLLPHPSWTYNVDEVASPDYIEIPD